MNEYNKNTNNLNHNKNDNQNKNKNTDKIKNKRNIYLYIIIGLLILNVILLSFTVKPALTLEQQIGNLYNQNQTTRHQIQKLKIILNGGQIK